MRSRVGCVDSSLSLTSSTFILRAKLTATFRASNIFLRHSTAGCQARRWYRLRIKTLAYVTSHNPAVTGQGAHQKKLNSHVPVLSINVDNKSGPTVNPNQSTVGITWGKTKMKKEAGKTQSIASNRRQKTREVTCRH